MSYRQIANLRGPAGFTHESVVPLVLGSHNLDSLEPGVYRNASASQGLALGLPEDRTGSLEVMTATSVRRIQRFTTSASGAGDRSDVWVRGSGFTTGWSPWEKTSVRSSGVSQIVTTKDAEYPMSDGDLVFLMETPTYFTDFTGYASGSQPYDWTSRWEGGTFRVESENASPTGTALLYTGGPSGTRAGLSWDLLDDISDDGEPVETVWKWRGGGSVNPRATFRGSGSAGNETGYFAGVNGSIQGDVVGAWYDGGSSWWTSDSGVTPQVPDEWWATRARFAPNQRLYVRSWRWGTPEPSEWSRTINIATSHPAGWTGMLFLGSGYVQLDWLGVAYEGGRAPVGG